MLKFTHKGRLEHLLVSLNVTGLWGVVRGFLLINMMKSISYKLESLQIKSYNGGLTWSEDGVVSGWDVSGGDGEDCVGDGGEVSGGESVCSGDWTVSWGQSGSQVNVPRLSTTDVSVRTRATGGSTRGSANISASTWIGTIARTVQRITRGNWVQRGDSGTEGVALNTTSVILTITRRPARWGRGDATARWRAWAASGRGAWATGDWARARRATRRTRRARWATWDWWAFSGAGRTRATRWARWARNAWSPNWRISSNDWFRIGKFTASTASVTLGLGASSNLLMLFGRNHDENGGCNC